MNHTEATQHIKATLAAFGPSEAISMTQDTWAKLHDAMSVLIEQPAQHEPVALKHRLVKIHDALCNDLGDSDPYIDEDMTDEEICEEMPVFWAAKEIADLIGDAPWTQYTSPPAQRTFVGLTDVEWMNIVNKNQAWFGIQPDEVAHEVCKLTEAKLREKNGGAA